MKSSLIVMILSITLLFVSCSPTSPEAEEQFCQSMTELETSLKNLKSASENGDKEALESAWDETVDAYGTMRDSAEQMKEVKLNDLSLAWRNLEVTVGAALGVSDPVDSLAGIDQAWSNVKSAFDELFKVNCQ